MPKSQVDILAEAEKLALRLSRPVEVKKNVLLSLVADFMSSPRPDRARLRQTLELIGAGSGGHLLRAGGYGEQVQAAVEVLLPVLAEAGWDDAETKSLFGWTARLLQAKPDSVPVAAASSPPRDRQPSRRPPLSPPSAPKPFGGLKAEGRSALEEMKRKLKEKEEEEEEGGPGKGR